MVSSRTSMATPLSEETMVRKWCCTSLYVQCRFPSSSFIHLCHQKTPLTEHTCVLTHAPINLYLRIGTSFCQSIIIIHFEYVKSQKCSDDNYT